MQSDDPASAATGARQERIVIGHAKKDKKHAKALAQAIHRRFALTAICQPGDVNRLTPEALATLIAHCKAFFPLFSKHSARSKWIRQWTELAVQHRVPVVAVADSDLPPDFSERSHVVTAGKKFAKLKERLHALDLEQVIAAQPSGSAQEMAQSRPTAAERRPSNAPTASVLAVVHRSHMGDDGILLLRHASESSDRKWHLPGGPIERYEPAQDAVVRHVNAATELEFEPSFLSYFDEIQPQHAHHRVVIGFVGPGSGEVRLDRGDFGEAVWRPVLDALTLDLAATDRQVLQAFAEGV